MAMAAGSVTVLAGLLFILNPDDPFLPGGDADHRLAVRPGAILVSRAASPADRCASGPPCRREWTSCSAILLVAGLSISTIIVSMFGPTPRADRQLRLVRSPRASSSTACCCSRSRAASSELPSS